MKKLYILLTFLCLTLLLQAQVSKTVKVTAGNLNSLLSETELNTVTDLTITGTIDARDFKTMRDSMPGLSELDISQATILEYTGNSGTYFYVAYPVTYNSNTIPQMAFLKEDLQPNTTLTSVKIPLNTQVIEQAAFAGCHALKDFTIPASVKWIMQSAFSECIGLTSITIPSTVTFLGWDAFARCTGLTSMVIPPSINDLKDYLFSGCTGLTSVELPSTIIIIGNKAFADCSSLVSLHIPDAVVSIGSYAFVGCNALESMNIPASLAFIGEGAFDGLSKWKGALNLPQGLNNIEALTFRNCSSLSSVQLPSSLDSIRASAFEGCTGWSGSLILPPTLKLIDGRAFYNCSQLTGTLAFPETLAFIGISSFEGCKALTGELIIPPLVSTVQDHSFARCNGFSSLTIPATVDFINSGAFSGCSGLTTIHTQSATPVPLEDVTAVFEGVDKNTTSLHVPFGAKEAYATAEGWDEFTTIIEDTQGISLSTTTLGFSPEGGSNNSINLQANVAWTATSDRSWLNVSPLSGNNSQMLTLIAAANSTNASRTGTITIAAPGVASQEIHVTQESTPVVVQSVAGHLREIITEEQTQTITNLVITGTMNALDFGFVSDMPLLARLDLSGVTITPYYVEIMRYDIYFPEHVIPGTRGGFGYPYTLTDMPNLASLILPSTAIGIEEQAFEGCTSLRDIEIPSSVVSIGNEAFINCTALTTIKIPSSVVELGYGIFKGCKSLTSVELPEGITALDGTFTNCTALRTINLPSSLKDLGSETFSNCSSLIQLEIPPLVINIGSSTFLNCTALSSVKMPPSLEFIGYYAFSGCTALTSITIPSRVDYIGPAAFGDCRALETIYTYPVHPPRKEGPGREEAFTNVDKANCLVYVPVGSKELYEQAEDWEGFTHIIEMEGLMLSDNNFISEASTGTASVEVTSPGLWTAASDQSWLSIAPASGSGSTTVTLSWEANTSFSNRIATVTFTSGDQAPLTVTVVQQGYTATIDLTAGQLNSTFTPVALKGIQRLVLKGTMDARDFKTIRDKMITLTELDLREVSIIAYSGKEGTHGSMYIEEGDTLIDSFDYPANEIPYRAFNGNCKLLTTVNLPPSITSIGVGAFTDLPLLTGLVIPSTVNQIGAGAFAGCKSLKKIVLPPLITQIKQSLFENGGLTSINIPPGVNSIEHIAFAYCDSLSSIYSYALYPPELTWEYQTVQVFFNLDKSKCTLYVPYGSKELYAKAPNEWKEFPNIIEMPGFRLSAATVAVKKEQDTTASVVIHSDVSWTAGSDQSWLTITPSSGTGHDTLLFSVAANTMNAGRMARVTVMATDVSPQTITVIQEGRADTVRLTPGSLATTFTAEALSSITNLTLRGEMDARDFRVLRDQMPLLTTLDLSAATIKEYKETDPITKEVTTFRENGIPDMAFFDPIEWKGKASLTSVILPNSLEKIGDRAFSNATGLTKIIIPETVSFIDYSSFNYCPYLKTIISYMETPPGSYDYNISFYNVDKEDCIVYVPKGTKALYAESRMWKDFFNIVEMGDVVLSETTVTLEAPQGSSATIALTGNAEWTAVSDQSWLSVNPANGTGNQTLIFTADANPEDTSRIATVMVTVPGMEAHLILVTQHGLPTGVDGLAQDRLFLSCYPNPFTNELSIEIANPSHKEINVDIYSISGQKIKTLIRALKGQNNSLKWDGTNEAGQKVVPGFYLLKVNEEMRKVMKD